MTDMLTRAAKALTAQRNIAPNHAEADARVALLAALDSEDKALVEEFAHGRWMRRFKHASSMDWHVQKAELIMHPGVQNSVAAELVAAKQDIAALQNFVDAAQGETAP